MIILNDKNVRILTVLIIFFILMSILLTYKENLNFSYKDDVNLEKNLNINSVYSSDDNYHKEWRKQVEDEEAYKTNINRKYSEFIDNNISDVFEKHKIDNPDYKCNDPQNVASGNCRFKNGKRFGWAGQHSSPSSIDNYCKDHNNNILKNEFCTGSNIEEQLNQHNTFISHHKEDIPKYETDKEKKELAKQIEQKKQVELDISKINSDDLKLFSAPINKIDPEPHNPADINGYSDKIVNYPRKPMNKRPKTILRDVQEIMSDDIPDAAPKCMKSKLYEKPEDPNNSENNFHNFLNQNLGRETVLSRIKEKKPNNTVAGNQKVSMRIPNYIWPNTEKIEYFKEDEKDDSKIEGEIDSESSINIPAFNINVVDVNFPNESYTRTPSLIQTREFLEIDKQFIENEDVIQENDINYTTPVTPYPEIDLSKYGKKGTISGLDRDTRYWPWNIVH
jgi:hypothetical protein